MFVASGTETMDLKALQTVRPQTNPKPSLHVYVYILLLLLTFEPSLSGLFDYVRMLILFSGGGRP